MCLGHLHIYWFSPTLTSVSICLYEKWMKSSGTFFDSSTVHIECLFRRSNCRILSSTAMLCEFCCKFQFEMMIWSTTKFSHLLEMYRVGCWRASYRTLQYPLTHSRAHTHTLRDTDTSNTNFRPIFNHSFLFSFFVFLLLLQLEHFSDVYDRSIISCGFFLLVEIIRAPTTMYNEQQS